MGLLSSVLFNIFLERIMCEALDDHEGSVSSGGQLITTFHFADAIVVNAEKEYEAGVLVDRLDTNITRNKTETDPDKTKAMTNSPWYKMEIDPNKTKVMINNQNFFQSENKIKGQRLEAVKNFKYLGATIS